MNKIRLLTAFGLAVLGIFGSGVSALAQDSKAVDRVMMKDGKMWETQGGQTTLMDQETRLPYDVTVKTNGTYTVKQGKERQFKEGQILRSDGMLISPDGSIVPVYDHITMKAGKPMITRDGSTEPLQSTIKLADGTRIQPDGYVVKPDGRTLRLLDGQIFQLSGKTIPATDTITLKGGKVIVQKDGSLITVAPGRSLMMNDGTKVFGDGTVLMKDGTKKKLAEGELLTVPGLVTRR